MPHDLARITFTHCSPYFVWFPMTAREERAPVLWREALSPPHAAAEHNLNGTHAVLRAVHGGQCGPNNGSLFQAQQKPGRIASSSWDSAIQNFCCGGARVCNPATACKLLNSLLRLYGWSLHGWQCMQVTGQPKPSGKGPTEFKQPW